MPSLLLQARDWFDVATGVAQMITAFAIVAAVVFAGGMLFALRAAARGVADAVAGAKDEIGPLLRQARGIADDVQAMTQAARLEVERVRGLVEDATGRASAALDAAESRLRRLDALAGAVQDEAEAAVVRTAAAVRGATTTLESLRHEFLDAQGDDDEDDDEDVYEEAFGEGDAHDDATTGRARPDSGLDDPGSDDRLPPGLAESLDGERPRIRHRPHVPHVPHDE